MKKNKNFWFLTLFVVLNTSLVVAQTDDTPEPPPGVPVDQYVIIAALISIVLVFVFFTKSKKLQNNNDINL